jgi:serine protease Do
MPRHVPAPRSLALIAVGLALGLAAGRASPPLLSARAQGPVPKVAEGEPTPLPSAGSDDEAYARLDRQYEQFAVIDKTYALVSRLVSPTVVHIVARKGGRRDDGTPARFEETGSGVIVRADADGGRGRYVLTNYHVVAGARAEEITISLQDGRALRPDRVWFDEKADVAVLKLDRIDLPAARLGNSDETPVGTWVLAVGSPFGLTHSVSQGIISARGRFEAELEDEGVENQDFLQTDAAINPGNSGGPLVNMRGEVVGINTAIASNGGGSEGVGFSIPINLARWAMNQLVVSGRVERGALGVKLQDIAPQWAAEIGLERPRGARIDSVQAGTPAAEAGLRRGDVVLTFNGIPVVDYNHLINMVSMSPVGSTAALSVWRDRQTHEVRVKVADRGAILAAQGTEPARVAPGGLVRRPRPPRAPSGTLPAAEGGLARGLELTDVENAAAARRFGFADATRGVVVVRVESGAPLAAVLRAGDLIQAIDGQPPRHAEDALRGLSARGDHAIQFLRIEKGKAQSRVIQVPGA